MQFLIKPITCIRHCRFKVKIKGDLNCLYRKYILILNFGNTYILTEVVLLKSVPIRAPDLSIALFFRIRFLAAPKIVYVPLSLLRLVYKETNTKEQLVQTNNKNGNFFAETVRNLYEIFGRNNVPYKGTFICTL